MDSSAPVSTRMRRLCSVSEPAPAAKTGWVVQRVTSVPQPHRKLVMFNVHKIPTTFFDNFQQFGVMIENQYYPTDRSILRVRARVAMMAFFSALGSRLQTADVERVAALLYEPMLNLLPRQPERFMFQIVHRPLTINLRTDAGFLEHRVKTGETFLHTIATKTW